MTRLTLSLLGPKQILLDSKPVRAFTYNKAVALLAYLAVETGIPHSRQELVGLLWPELPTAAALTNLRQVLADLRHVIGDETAEPPLLLITRESIQLNAAGEIDLDSATFLQTLFSCEAHHHRHIDRCRICQARLEMAMALYRGDFLRGFSVEGAAPFEDWVAYRREQYHQRAQQMLVHMVNYQLRCRNDDKAQRYLHRQVELEPWNEEAHQQLMRLYSRNGHRSSALIQFEICRRILSAELGVGPSPLTQRLYEQIRDGLPLDEEISAHPPRFWHNLPLATTSLVGRTKELAQLGELLADPVRRLITILGPGGIGKTRLALASATENAVGFRNGVLFVALAGVSDSHFLPNAIIAALDTPLPAEHSPQEQLLALLRDKELLLLLDNYEQFLPDVTFITHLLRSVPAVTVLVTSRERLAMQAEYVIDIEGLEYPQNASALSANSLSEYSALQLFVERARQVQHDVTFTTADMSAILRIGRVTEGMPLAIELAAGWIDVLPPHDIAQAIGRSLDFLSSEAKDLPVRQRSIRAVFTASWQLLSPAEQNVFQKLAVFRGGFTLAAAEAVAMATPKLLLSLIGKSFVQRREAGRFEIHELLRQYGMEQLETSGDLLGVQAGHAEYFAIWSEHARQQLWGNEQSKWIKQFEVEHDNLRAGLAWGLANRATELVLRMTLPLQAFWTWRAYDLEMNQWFDQIFALVDQRWGTFEANEINELDDSQRQQLTLYADALLTRAESLPFAVAEELYHRCLALDQQIGPTINTIIVYDCLADGARDRGDYALAETWHRTAAETVPTLQLTEHELLNQNAFVAYRWSENALAQGHLEQCAALAQQAAMLFDQLENQRFATYCRYQVALSVLHGDDPKRALPLLEHCFSCFQEMGATDASSWVKCALGHLFLYIGELADAHAAFIESIKLRPQSSRFGNLLGLAGLSNQLGNYPRAATLLGAMEKIRAEEGYVIHPVSQPQLTATLAATRAHLDDSTFDTAWSMGCRMTMDEVVAFALAEHA